MSSPDGSCSRPARTLSDRTPNQLITWWDHNCGTGDGGHAGEWLRCLKSTRAGDRQLVWSGGAIAAIVTFAASTRGADRLIEGWGSAARFKFPITRERLLNDRRTAWRFDDRGIKALQGLPIRIDKALSSAILDLGSPVGATPIPLDAPDNSAETTLWTGPDGLEPESVIEAAVASRRRLWRRFGFPAAQRRQVSLGNAGRVDLLEGDVCGECKRAATIASVEQLERYLDHLMRVRRRPRSELRGLLLQCAANASGPVTDRVRQSQFHLELWSVRDDGYGWDVEQLA